jgi:serine/threonine protein kinase
MRYLAMEFIPGESLRERLDREGPVPPGEAGLLSLQLTRAVAALHARGLVHHDIKPDNVKFGPTGLAVLLDLGSARVAAAGSVLLQPVGIAPTGYFSAHYSSGIAGTPGYMAPELREMVEADRVSSDPSLDVFALGCTIHEMVTNERMSQESIDRREESLIADAVQRVAARCPQLAAPLAQALALSAQDRYASAHHLLAELEQVIPPCPALRHRRLDFRLTAGHPEDEQVLVVTNAGGGRLQGVVRSEHPSIGFRRPDGTTTKEVTFAGNLELLRAVANGGRAGASEEAGRLLVETDQGSADVTCYVWREATAPILSLTPSRATLRLSRDTLQQLTVRVANRGASGRVVAQASPGGRVQVTPEEADAPAGAEVAFRVRPQRGSLPPGRHQVKITFATEGGGAGPALHLTIEVSGLQWPHRARR